ncbi:MAG: hypothetical protein H0X62_03265 [Bacteroidetes bacterium]|nr:hypothetical protein [Bacteroidota bacterium]
MFKAVSTYTLQRFKPLTFLSLAVFLLLFAHPGFPKAADWAILFWLLPLLFVFRLFDDLANKEIDAEKPNRLYTKADEAKKLNTALHIAFALVAIPLLFIDINISLILTAFYLVNLMVYRLFFKTGNFRFVLPLLKYPLIVFLISLVLGQTAGPGQFLKAISLIPAFILFEHYDEPEFNIAFFYQAMALILLNLLIIFPDFSFWTIIFSIAGILFFLSMHLLKHQKPYLAYLVLLFALLLNIYCKNPWNFNLFPL